MRFPAKFPWRWGAADLTLDQEHQAILDALAPGWDVDTDTQAYAEAGTDALAVTMIWQANRRFGNQAVPPKMLGDTLKAYERATNLRPRPTESRRARRNALAGKLRGLGRNTFDDLEDAASKAAGSAFVALVAPNTDDIFSYWPGVNPGPPGFEFMSKRAQICVHLRDDGLSDQEFRRVARQVVDAMDAVKPAWLRVVVGQGTGSSATLVAGIGIAGLTVI